MFEWIQNHEIAFAWLAALSTFTFIATLIAVPIFAVRVPPDYFVSVKTQKQLLPSASPIIRLLLGVLKSLLGLVLIAAGILMLVLPGQGILAILFGLVLLDVPGTSRLGRWIVQRPPVWASINWLRRKAGRAPLAEEEHCK